MNSITQDMKFRYSLMKYAEKFGAARASRKYNKTKSDIYFWKARYDGSIESLACRSRRPHSQPAYRSGIEADSRYAPAQSKAGKSGAVEASAQARLQPMSGKSVARFAA